MNGLTKLGETHTNNQFSLGLELERAKRDLARCQSELDARRREMDENDEEARERDSRMASLVSTIFFLDFVLHSMLTLCHLLAS